MSRLMYATSTSFVFVLSIFFSIHVQASTPPKKPLHPFVTAPVIQANAADTTDVTVDCVDDIPAAIQLTAIDDVDAPQQITPTDSPLASSLNRCTGGTITRRWIAVDSENLTDTVTQIITILPDTKPPVPLLAEVKDTFDCDAPNSDYTTWLNTTQLSLSSSIQECNPGTITNNSTGIFNPRPRCGSIAITFTISDQCGNTAPWVATYTVVDNEPPQLIGLPAKLNDTISCTAPIPPMPTVTATDNCTPNLTVANTNTTGQTTDGTCSQYNYIIQRNWTVADSCGNVTNVTQRIFVRDNLPPSFTDPADLTITCGDNPANLTLTGNVTNLMDNCSDSAKIVLTRTDVRTDSICPFEYSIQRTWIATDVCGNSSTKVQVIDVVDDQQPTFVIPRDTTVTCEQTPSITVTGRPTQMDDNCDPDPKVEFEDVIQASTCGNTYTVRRTWRITDACGNKTEGLQLINVKDTLAPVFNTQAQNLTLVCDNALDASTAFNNWINTRGGATATDNCTGNASLIWRIVKSGTTDTVALPGIICPAPDSVIRLLAVDFIAQDECGNRDTSTASFSVIDDEAPSLRNCPNDTTIAVVGTDCELAFALQPPVIEEECASSNNTEDITIIKDITSNALPGTEAETPVNAVLFDFDLVTAPPVNVLANGTFTIQLNHIDGEGATEYFTIFAEDGANLGRTQIADEECDSSTTVLMLNARQLNTWAADGIIRFRLEPNIPAGQAGNLAINAICEPTSKAVGRLQIRTKNFTGLKYEYSVNGGARVPVAPIAPVDVTLPLGENDIVYYVTDCVGNLDSCIYTVTVADTIPPVLECPADITMQLDTGTCVAAIKLPLPIGATDNCSAGMTYESTLPANLVDAYLTFNLNTTLNTYQANEKIFTFTNVAANAISNATLTIDLLGDFNTNNAYFRIIGDDGIALDSTTVGLATCTMPGQKTITIPAAKINTWASDGTVVIKLQPRTAPPAVAGDGINPCDATKVSFNGDVDSTSFALATLNFDQLTPSFYATGATTLPLTQMTPPVVTPTVNFNVGETEVFYVLADKSGNRDTCSFTVKVEDKQLPIARCQPTTIFINPSGLEVETISPMVVNAGSRDNCGIDTMFLTPSTFNCTQVEMNATVMLTVIDMAGNMATCQSLVRIEAEEPQPTATSGLCGGDTLFLFANPPAATGGVIYTYKWTGPNGFSSTRQNPTILNINAQNAGTYTVEVSGITGCKSIGAVQVSIEDLPFTPTLLSTANVCINQDIILNSSVVPSGSAVTYRWYRGTPPNGALLGTTTVPSFTIPQPHAPGSNMYYLTIEADGCLSAPSAPTTVTANSMPIAAVNDTVLTVCEGESVTLGTLVGGPGITYQWSGPNNYSSVNQFPAVINPITLAGAGVYRLVVLRNGCPSAPAFTVVNVKPRPGQPSVTNTSPACEGVNVTLSTTTTGASVYHWVAPNLQEFLTTTNTFVISNIAKNQEGSWRLYVTQNGCNSVLSTATPVIVNTVPLTVASANPTEVCEGNTLQLSASPTLANATYSWTGPNGYTAAMQNPPIPNVTQAREGNYQVTITTQEGCSKSATVPVDVRRGVSITGVSNDGQDCLPGPTDIRLRATVFPSNDGNYRYRWTGPSFSSSDSIAVIPNGTQANNGNYQLVVTNGDGCESQPMTTVIDVSLPPATPAAPTISAGTPGSLCEGKAISLVVTAYNGSVVSYNWKTPKGLVITQTPSLTIASPSPADSGLYAVTVIVDGCTSKESGSIAVNINRVPRIFATGNSPVCTGDVIQLNATALAGATYAWSGPAGFTSATSNPQILAANATIHAGFYKVSATINGCISNLDSVRVNVNLRPNVPSATDNGPICISNANTVLRLSIVPGTAVPNAIYTWYDQLGNLVGETQSLNLDLTDFENYGNGNYLFTVTATVNGCSSAPSDPTIVPMNAIPNEQAFAGQDKTVCEADSITFSGFQPASGSGFWTTIRGNNTSVRILQPTSSTSQITGLKGDSTYTFRWTLSNGACTSYAFDDVTYKITPIEAAFAGEDTLVCSTDTIRLDALLPISGEGRWSQSEAQQALGLRIIEPLNPETVIRGLQPGNRYEFTWTIVSGCGGLFDKVTVLTSDTRPDAGDNAIVCNEDQTVELDAATPAQLISFGKWSSPNPKIVFSDTLDPSATAFNLEVGSNIFVWTIDESLCGSAGRDTVILTYKQNPLAIDDVVGIEFGTATEFNPLLNDTIPQLTTVTLLTQPTKGTVTLANNGIFRYTPGINYVGADQLTYQICSAGCECSDAKVTLQVGQDAGCVVPSIITPNNDGINDFFVIPCFITDTNYPGSQVSIFNRWGDEVYHSPKPYRNNWDGTFNGQDLPPGTYFYLVDLGDGSEAKTGFIMIQR